MLPDGQVRTAHGKQLSLFKADWKNILEELHQAWPEYVATQLSHKEEFRYLPLVDLAHVSRLRQQCKFDLSMLGCCTTGAALTTEHKKHFLGEQEMVCKYCGAEDAQRHRMLFCPAHQECRAGLHTEEMEHWPTLMVERGLASRPWALEDWECHASQRSLPNFSVFFLEPVHVFTDGSTSNATLVPSSSWSVIGRP